MENLNQGQEISKFRRNFFEEGTFRTTLFWGVGASILGFILYFLEIYLLDKVFKYTLPNNLTDLLIYLNIFISGIGLLFVYEPHFSKYNNPSVTFFTNYLLVRNERGEVEVPFKMIKRFRLLENNKKVVLEYKEEYINSVNRKEDGNNFMYIDGYIWWDDNMEFSFRLNSNSRNINISIVDELNKRIV
jgi:hypothetical protein